MDRPASIDFPDLRGTKRIGLDIETHDEHLKELGPGVRRGAEIAGVSVAYNHDGQTFSNYYPIRHEGGDNYPVGKVIQYLADNITDQQKEIAGANLLYDLDFLAEAGVEVKGKLFDVQVAEPLIDENKRGSYDLGSLSEHYLGHGKDGDQELYQYLADNYGNRATRGVQAKRIWKAPGKVVAPYARSDAENPLGIIHEQLKIIEQEKLTEVWQLEQDLQPMLLSMRRRGVPIAHDKAQQAADEMDNRIEEMRQQLDEWGIEPTRAVTIGTYLDRIGIPYGITPKNGQPSITDAFLQKHRDIEAMRVLSEVRKASKSSGTFIHGLLKHMTNGRVHGEFNQLASDTYGTVSGRLSSSHPNLQNMPAREELVAALIRGLFIPEEGEDWGCSDYSQIEYRMLIEYAFRHYKGGKGSMEMLNTFIDDPTTDMHQAVADLCGIGRLQGKTINFGMVYGLGLNSLIAKLGYDRDVCMEIIDKYHGMMPFAKQLYKDASKLAGARGFIRTLGGRVRRFKKWEPIIPWQAREGTFDGRLKQWMRYNEKKKEWQRDLSNRPKALLAEAAQEEYEGLVLERSHTHTALNALLQGSAADIMKRAMVDIWHSGVCDVLGAPFLTVHDELNWSVPRTKAGREAFAESNRIMEAVYSTGKKKLRIPLKVDTATGANWAACK
jgi:DNA polymerase I-like protein with 3'-5' exonuclease and polymerase domains